MAAEWSFTQCTLNESRNHKEYTELYERAREATREAQRQGDAQLKAAMAAATAAPISRVRIWPLSLLANISGAEKVYRQKLSMTLDRKDVFFIVFQLVLHALFQNQSSQSFATAYKTHTGLALTGVVLCLWMAALCITMLIIRSRCPSWYEGSRGIILLLAFCVLWFGEVMAVSAPVWYSVLGIAHIVSQCIFSSMLHRAPFNLHYKTRLFGCGLQMFGTLAMAARVQEALPSILFFSMSHVLGVGLAYISDQQSRGGFLKSSLHFDTDNMVGDCQISSQQAPKRALGGFAGGFAGVSSLRCTYPPSIWTVLSSSYADSSREDCVSEISCSNLSSTVESSISSFSSRHQYISCLSSSNKETAPRSSDTVCSASSALECNVYWQFRAATRGTCDG